MPTDDDADDEAAFGAPLPPDDRLWRHPSELGADGDKQQIVIVSKNTSIVRTILVALLAGLVGAGATVAVVLGTDAFVREKPGTTSVERVVADLPRVPGESELAIADKVLPAVARVDASGPNGLVSGTAVAFRSDGEMITTADVVDGATAISVYLNDGTKLDASLVGRSVDADVAVIRVARDDLVVAAGSQRAARFRDLPLMIDASNRTHGPEITVGVVTQETTQVSRGEGKSPVYGLIQVTTQATVSPRSAGSLVIDNSGAVVGMISSRAEGIATANQTKTALHFALPASYVWDIAAQIADSGKVVRPWLGISGEDISPGDAVNLDIVGGLRVTQIEDASPARVAGLQNGDVIVAIDSDNISSYNDVVVAVRHHKPGDQVTVRYVGKNHSTDVAFATLQGKPESP